MSRGASVGDWLASLRPATCGHHCYRHAAAMSCVSTSRINQGWRRCAPAQRTRMDAVLTGPGECMYTRSPPRDSHQGMAKVRPNPVADPMQCTRSVKGVVSQQASTGDGATAPRPRRCARASCSQVRGDACTPAPRLLTRKRSRVPCNKYIPLTDSNDIVSKAQPHARAKTAIFQQPINTKNRK